MATTAKKPRKRASKKGEVNKSEEIRKEFAKRGIRTKRDIIVESLAKKGIEVSPTLVSQVKSSRRKKRRKATAAKTAKPSIPTVRVNDLIAAKTFVEKVGSLPRATEAMSTLAKLRS